jgi:hypothetical protein
MRRGGDLTSPPDKAYGKRGSLPAVANLGKRRVANVGCGAFSGRLFLGNR